ncbi:Cupredoxin-like domain-containing protein [Melghirimyces thermohalophilus]|uniref:Cupredoxin-like domain-containing protein n=1 Tax=Melghirimyces thermohalophilus TaxID=1236220 RepID=A0A1G6IYR7_9BACL|nr:cupredoxin domain-containing protein [Melghirimyces thermohalophilus]SDC11551.1 Cupredoxin-like domain-containing protein [Melghirimyces thermohalophilus]
MTTSRQWLYLSFAFALVLIATAALLPIPWFNGNTVVEEVEEVSSRAPAPADQTFHLVTTEYKTEHRGKELEVYRWNPGNLVVREGDRVHLVLHGLHGKEHHFSLKEFGVQGTVRKGEKTTVNFTADRPGTYELVCDNHHTAKSNGPMVAYITVLGKEG